MLCGGVHVLVFFSRVFFLEKIAFPSPISCEICEISKGYLACQWLSLDFILLPIPVTMLSFILHKLLYLYALCKKNQKMTYLRKAVVYSTPLKTSSSKILKKCGNFKLKKQLQTKITNQTTINSVVETIMKMFALLSSQMKHWWVFSERFYMVFTRHHIINLNTQ